jgi:4-hydroxymandelate synthase
MLPMIEPDESMTAGVIVDFLENHGGGGIQHLGFRVDNIVDYTAKLRKAGVAMVTPPDAYYDLIPNRFQPKRYSIDALKSQRILTDEDDFGQLFQSFTLSTHPRDTLYYEFMERDGARGGGAGNRKVLQEAAALEEQRRQSAAE